jgi:hypothetical protein
MPVDAYGRTYYALDKKGVLNLVGDEAPYNIRKRYRFDLTDDEIEQHGLSGLPQEERK